jgi:pseudouridine-5'-phosphate glycosidase
VKIEKSVAQALADKKPVVALESTIISHGLPRPSNLEVAKEVEEIVRQKGATPATIAIIDGEIHVGLTDSQLDRIANEDGIAKASIRDLPIIALQKLSAATTVAATSHIAHMAGITLFATGGLGGVHRGHTYDESTDLIALASKPIIIVCAGVKSILDVPGTLERLETYAIPVVGYQTKQFPGFYLADSGYTLDHRVESSAEIAEIWALRHNVGINSTALVVAQPVKTEMDRARHDALLTTGLAAAEKAGVSGKAVTPFLLEYFHRESHGESLRVNIEIIKSNTALASDIAVSLAEQRKSF